MGATAQGDATGNIPRKKIGNSATIGEPLAKFWPQGLERPNPPTQAYGHGGGGREATGVPAETATGLDIFSDSANRGEPLERNFLQGSERPTPPPTHAYRHRGKGRVEIGVPAETATCEDKFKIW